MWPHRSVWHHGIRAPTCIGFESSKDCITLDLFHDMNMTTRKRLKRLVISAACILAAAIVIPRHPVLGSVAVVMSLYSMLICIACIHPETDSQQEWSTVKAVVRVQVRSIVDGSTIYSYECKGNTVRQTLERAVREKVRLCNACLNGADLDRASLNGADLSGACLQGASLQGASLRGADLSYTDLSGADFTDADMSGAFLYEANLSKAMLSGADLHRSNLCRASLEGASCMYANFSSANLHEADIDKADFNHACLEGVELEPGAKGSAK